GSAASRPRRARSSRDCARAPARACSAAAARISRWARSPLPARVRRSGRDAHHHAAAGGAARGRAAAREGGALARLCARGLHVRGAADPLPGNSLEAELRRLERYHVLVVEEVGYLPLERQAANLL